MSCRSEQKLTCDIAKVLRPELTAERQRLFRAAEGHDWSAVLRMLAEDKQSKLVNAGCPDVSTGYTLLHHAAAADAPAEVIERLIQEGAFRSVCCHNRERPIDIAERLGFGGLFPIAAEYDQEDFVLLVRSYQRMGGGRERHFVITPHGRQLVSVKDFG